MGFRGLSKLGGKKKAPSEASGPAPAKRAAPPMRTGAPPISIDFGVGSLKVLQVTGAEPPALVAGACVDVPEEIQNDAARRLRWQLDELPKILKKGGFKSARAVCGIPAGQMFCKHLQIINTDGVSRDEIARAAVAKQLGCDPTSLVCRHEDVKELPGGKTEVICFAAARELVSRMMMTLKNAKIEPVGIHAEPQALVRALSAGEPGEPPPTLYLDIGRGSTTVIVAQGPSIKFARVVNYGGLQLDEAVSHQLKCTMTRASERRLELKSLIPQEAGAVDSVSDDPEPGHTEPGAGPTLAREQLRRVEHAIDLSEPAEILTDEIRMCLRYHKALFPEDPARRVVFVGGEARHLALCEHVARMLRLPAEIADPMARVARTGKEPTTGLHIEEPQPGWAVPLGMCLSPTDL